MKKQFSMEGNMGEERWTYSDQTMRDYFDSLFFKMQHIDGKRPDTSFALYGETFNTPIMAAALSDSACMDESLKRNLAEGATMMGTVSWIGMGEGEIPEKEVKDAKSIKLIKPYEDNQLIFDQIAAAEKCGALAVGIEIDSVFNGRGECNSVRGHELAPKSAEEIREFANAASLPFLVKGVLSEKDAYKSVNAGAKGIVVSLPRSATDYAVPPLMILPEIIKAVGKEIPVFFEGGIFSGLDAFKALAFGAHGVLADFTILPPPDEEGAEGIAETIRILNNELKCAMARTGCYDMNHMDDSVIVKK